MSFEPVKIFADSDEAADMMEAVARESGVEVSGRVLWDGIIPPNSFVHIGNGMRMATPEFFLFRKCLGEDAFPYACEMLGRIGTSLTCCDLKEGQYRVFDEPRTTFGDMCEYLSAIPLDDDEHVEMVSRCLEVMFAANDVSWLYEGYVTDTMKLA